MIRTTIRGIRLASLLLGAYWLLLFTATHWPNVRLPNIDNADKYVHFAGFAGLSFLMAWAIPTIGRMRWLNALLALLTAVAYGAIDEISQAPVGRTTDIVDWAADCSGAVFGVLCYLLLRQIIVMQSKSRPVPQPRTLEVPLV